jgi:cobalt/nickel transport system permease protein
VSSAHRQEQAAARLHSPVSRLAPGPKVAGLVAFLVVVAVTPAGAPVALAAEAGIAAAVATIALVDWRAVAGRLTLDLPLAVLAVTYALAGRPPHVEVAGLALSEPGLRAGLAILARATIAIVAVSALAASTSVPEIVAGLGRVGAPAWFRHLVAVTARQLGVLRADLARLRLAVAVRTGTGGRLAAVTTGTQALGSLFVRATERSDRLRLAADLRGATGASPEPAVTTGAEGTAAWALALVPAALAVIVRVVWG